MSGRSLVTFRLSVNIALLKLTDIKTNCYSEVKRMQRDFYCTRANFALSSRLNEVQRFATFSILICKLYFREN